MSYTVTASDPSLPPLDHATLRAARIAAQRRAKRRHMRQYIVDKTSGKVVIKYDGRGKRMREDGQVYCADMR